MVALMKRLSLSAEGKERSAAVTEIVDLVKKGGVAALKVCTPLLLLLLRYPAQQVLFACLSAWELVPSACGLCVLSGLQADQRWGLYDCIYLLPVRLGTCS